MEEKKLQCSLHTQKSNKRMMVGTITWETDREGQRKAKSHIAYRNPKKGEN
jgi:hypothetical protein